MRRKTGRGRKPPVRTDAVYVALCIPDSPHMYGLPTEPLVIALGSSTTVLHGNKCPNNVSFMPPYISPQQVESNFRDL